MAPPQRPQNHPKKPRRPQRGQGSSTAPAKEAATGSSPKQVPKARTARKLPRKPVPKEAVEVDTSVDDEIVDEVEDDDEILDHRDSVGDSMQQLREGRRFSTRGGPPKPSRENERLAAFGTVQISVPASESHLFAKWAKWDLNDWAAAFCVEIKRGDYDQNLEEVIAAINERCTDVGQEGIDFDSDEADDGDADQESDELETPVTAASTNYWAGGRKQMQSIKVGSNVVIMTPRRSKYNDMIMLVTRLNTKTVSGTIMSGVNRGRRFRAPRDYCFQPTPADMVRYQP